MDETRLLPWVYAYPRRGSSLTGKNFSDMQKQEVLRLCRQRFLRKIRANKPGETEEEPSNLHCFNTLVRILADITSLRKML